MKLPEEFKPLLKLSKEDIITILCETNYFLKPPTKKDILWLQYQRASDAAMKESKRLLAERDTILKLSAEHDKYAKLFNASEDIDEKLRLLEKMEPYYKASRENQKLWDAQRKLEEKADKIYKEWEKAAYDN